MRRIGIRAPSRTRSKSSVIEKLVARQKLNVRALQEGKSSLEMPTVLIISDEVDFSRRITAHWQMERNVPTFTLLSGELWPRFAVDVFDVAIVGQLRRDLLSVVLEPLHSTGQPVFCVCQDSATAQLIRDRWPRVSILRPSEHWLETLVLAAAEAVYR